MDSLVIWWLDWGTVACLLSSVFLAALVSFHGKRHRAPAAWMLASVLLAPVLILPSLILKTQVDLQSMIDLQLSEQRQTATTFFALGSIAWIAACVGAIGHFTLAAEPARPGTPRPPRRGVWLELWDGRWHSLYPLTATALTAGLDYRNQIVLDSPGVSQVHALIERHRNRIMLTDLGSQAGTFVNGMRVRRPMALKSGDVVSFGRVAKARLLET